MSVVLFDSEIAKHVGVHAAIIYERIRYFCEDAEAKNDQYKFKEGSFWTYSSAEGWAKMLPFLTARQVNRAIETLIVKSFIKTGTFNKNKYDRTRWYSILLKTETSILPKSKMHFTKDEPSISPNGQMETTVWVNENHQNVEPIPNESSKEPSDESVVVDYKDVTCREVTATPTSVNRNELFHYFQRNPYFKRLKALGAILRVSRYYGSLDNFKPTYDRLFDTYCKRKRFPGEDHPKTQEWYHDCYEYIENAVLKEVRNCL